MCFERCKSGKRIGRRSGVHSDGKTHDGNSKKRSKRLLKPISAQQSFGGCPRRLRSVWFIWSVSSSWLNQTERINQTDQIDPNNGLPMLADFFSILPGRNCEGKDAMQPKQRVIEHIREAFRETEHPGDAFLQGSHEGCEPAESVAPFIGVTDWSQVDPSILDASYDVLSFFSEGGFRYFLPAYLIADLQDLLQTADPVFHLTNGFSDKVVKLPAGSRIYEQTIGKSAFVNPRRYGAMTWHDYARCRLSIFTREEAGAIVAYLEYKRDADPHGLYAKEINAALDSFWRDRAANAPRHQIVRRHLKEEAEYLRNIKGGTSG